MEEERQSLETKRKILQKLKRLLDQWNDEFEGMDPDVRQYFDRVDKDLKHLDKNLRNYFEKLSKEFEVEETEYKKQLKAKKKAEREKAAAAASETEETPQKETENENVAIDANEWTHEMNQTAAAEPAASGAGPSTDAVTSEGQMRRPTTDENRGPKQHFSRREILQREAAHGSSRSGIIDMRALFEEAIANCTDSSGRYQE